MDSPSALYLNPFQLKIPNLRIEADFFSDSEVLILADEFPQQAPVIYFALILGMAREGGYLPRNFLPSVAKRTHFPIKIVQDVLAGAINLGFIQDAPQGLTCKRVQRECENYAKQKFSKEKRPLIFPWECDPPPFSPVFTPPLTLDKSTIKGGSNPPCMYVGREVGKKVREEEGSGKEKPKAPEVPPPILPPPDAYLTEADTLLEIPDDAEPKAWQKSNLYIGAGRRPLKKHPDIFFTPGELAEVNRTFDKLGLARDALKDGITIANVELGKRKGRGERVPYENVVGWFLGFIPNELMQRQIKKQLIEKTKPNGTRVGA